MFLYQYFGYKRFMITEEKDIDNMVQIVSGVKEDFAVFDTETTGLHILTSTPFLFVCGFGKNIFVMDLVEDKELAHKFLATFNKLLDEVNILLAHNTEYDISMMMNYGVPINENVKLGDTASVYRLVEYSDLETHESLKSLEAIGAKYVSDKAKFAGRIIKDKIHTESARLNKELRAKYLEHFNFKAPGFTAMYKKAKDFDGVCKLTAPEEEDKEYLEFIRNNFYEVNYYTIYKQHPDLMINYAVDDIVLVREFFIRAFDTLNNVDPGLKIFNKECKLIRKTVRQMRTGLKVDMEYLKKSYAAAKEYQDTLYKELHEALGEELSVGQREAIGKIFELKYYTKLPKTDKGNVKLDNKTLVNLINETDNEDLRRVCLLIKKLRTVDKYISTYIVGAAKQEVNGRVHPQIDAAGTVSGRYSGNLQQLPKSALMSNVGNTKEEKAQAVELFHPRKVYVPDDDYALVFFDYSQQELRIQAYLTIVIGAGDLHLCRAYIPYQCYSKETKEEFDYTNRDHIARVDSGEWLLNESGEPWVETDVHSLTTKNAFPEFVDDKNDPDYGYYRTYGKVANFLKLYLGGVNALQETLECDTETAEALDKSFRETYLGVTAYQQDTINQATLNGYVENVYGRRYYLMRNRNAYKLANYKIQGTGADMIKLVELLVEELTENLLSYSALTVHDEIIMSIHKSETYLIPLIEEIMYKAGEAVAYVPMKVGIEYTTVNWGETEYYETEELLYQELRGRSDVHGGEELILELYQEVLDAV